MLALLLQADPQAEGQIERIARTFGVDWPHLIAQTVSFAIVCALLYWLAYRPVLQMLAARRQQIADGLANAEKLRAELAKTEVQRQEVLAKAHEQAKAIVQDARVTGSRIETLETQKAVLAAEAILAKAREMIAIERAEALAAVKREVGRLVVQTAAVVTGRVLTPDDHRRLAEETARHLTA